MNDSGFGPWRPNVENLALNQAAVDVLLPDVREGLPPEFIPIRHRLGTAFHRCLDIFPIAGSAVDVHRLGDELLISFRGRGGEEGPTAHKSKTKNLSLHVRRGCGRTP